LLFNSRSVSRRLKKWDIEGSLNGIKRVEKWGF